MDILLAARRESSIHRLRTVLLLINPTCTGNSEKTHTFFGTIKANVELAHVAIHERHLVVRHNSVLCVVRSMRCTGIETDPHSFMTSVSIRRFVEVCLDGNMISFH